MLPPVSDVVRARWVARTRAEIGSATAMSTIADRLEAVVPERPGVVRAIRRAAEDERRHAQLCTDVLALLDQAAPAPDEARPTLPLTESGDLKVGLAENVAFLLCAGEAIATSMLQAAAALAAEPGLRDVLSTIARDEERHAALGWVVLDALLDTMDEEERQAAAVPVTRQAIRAVMAAQAVGDAGEHGAAWGLLSGDAAFEIAKGVLKETIGPGLAQRGLWRVSD